MQLTYDDIAAQALDGMLADSGPNDVRSFAAEGAIAFGEGVVLGTDPVKQCTEPTAAGDTFAGVAMHDTTREADHVTGLAAYKDGDAVSVLRKGRVFVPIIVNITAGEQAFLHHTAGADRGKFTNVTSANTLTDPVGTFVGSGPDDGLAELDLNRP